MDLSVLQAAGTAVDTAEATGTWSFTGLEVLLISLGSATLGSITTIVSMLRWFPTRKQCESRHEREELIINQVAGSVKKFEQANDNQFRMLRALISHTPDLDARTREQILNITAEDSR